MNTSADLVSTVTKLLPGVWDCYGPSMATELIVNPNGQYVNTWYTAGQRFWGPWEVRSTSGYCQLHLTIAGAYPMEFVGPLGSSPIVWPPFEDWVILSVDGSRMSVYGGTTMVRRMGPMITVGQPPASAAEAAQPAPPSADVAVATSASSAFQAQMKIISDANADTLKTIGEMNAHASDVFEKSNAQFEAYLRS